MGQAARSGQCVGSWYDESASRDLAGSELAALRRAIECISDGLVITADPAEGGTPQVLFANAAFQAMANGADGDNTAGYVAPGSGPYRPGDNPLWISLKNSHLSDGVYSDEISCRSKGGAPTLIEFCSEPVRDPSGRTTHRVATFRDHTEQAAIEDLIHRNERLACIGLLAAGIAHEINNPTGAALLAAETALAIKDSPGAGDRLTACLENIVTSMDRCGRIVRTLLRYTREEPAEKQACNVNDVVEQAMDLARPYGSAHGANLRLELDSDLPLVPMNPLEIELVLVNLIRNAIEAGAGSVEVVVATSQTDRGVRLTVRDTGCGMNEEQLAHVFDPLYTTRRQLGGSGLGMSIAYGIVREHEGHIEVRSREGKCTTVTIDLPAAPGSKASGRQGQGSYGSNSDCREQPVLRRRLGLHARSGAT